MRLRHRNLHWHLLLLCIAAPALMTLGSVFASFWMGDADTMAHLREHVLPRALFNSLLLVLCVALLAGTLGVVLAWLTVACEFPLRRFFAWALFLPMAMPGYVMAFAFVGLFEHSGSVHNSLRAQWPGLDNWPNVFAFPSVVLVLSLVLYPYVYLLARSAFQTQAQRSLEVGQSLGLSPQQSFFRVALPMARPWIAGGVLLVAMETLADFGTVSVFNYDTMTTAVYKAWFSLFSLPAALRIAAVLLVFVLLLVVFERYTRRMRRYADNRSAPAHIQRQRLAPLRQSLALLLCTLVLLLAFILPAGQLLAWAIPKLSNELTTRFWSALLGTLTLAMLATSIVTSLALLLAFVGRMHPGPGVAVLVRLCTMGYALPGTVLAVGIFVPLAWLAQWLSANGVASGWLQGGLLVMMLGYSVRFMAVAFAPLETNLLRVTPSIDLAALSLGASGMQMLRRVHLPMMRSGLFTALVLVFVDVMKELPITLMTRPFGFNTLAVRIFEFTSEGMWERASLPALAIVVAGLLPVFLLVRSSNPLRKRASHVRAQSGNAPRAALVYSDG
ncbi:MAG: iron ABC transporter permease [Pseudomonadales bacterium]